MTTIFDGYDEEYRTLASDISKKLSEIASFDEQKDKKKASIVHVGDLLTQATQLIQQMELEVRSLDANTRRELSNKIHQYKKSLASLYGELTKIREKVEREGLFGDRDDNAALVDHRDRMAAATTKMQGTTNRLVAARKEIADTEEVALAIGEELSRNREKIEATHAKVKGVNEMARRGGNIVGRMSARNKRQRMALSIAAGFIIVAILLLIYFGIFKKK
ncbi:hypothetical protein CCR75_001192 [Bremia lactucae]|uniref:Vesicle transport v-SNARE N-terminal domain-containing protein n=1 Tax=Bremia lactucae TaxID=4779 RepID=A0A976FQ78_BRELC|nr:hypothetical protein CCR75_001192 [Bremia lactucae]